MYSLRPAFPRSFYLVGIATTCLLLITAALRPPHAPGMADGTAAAPASTPQLLAMELSR